MHMHMQMYQYIHTSMKAIPWPLLDRFSNMDTYADVAFTKL